jgi:hypothetical protein
MTTAIASLLSNLPSRWELILLGVRPYPVSAFFISVVITPYKPTPKLDTFQLQGHPHCDPAWSPLLLSPGAIRGRPRNRPTQRTRQARPHQYPDQETAAAEGSGSKEEARQARQRPRTPCISSHLPYASMHQSGTIMVVFLHAADKGKRPAEEADAGGAGSSRAKRTTAAVAETGPSTTAAGAGTSATAAAGPSRSGSVVGDGVSPLVLPPNETSFTRLGLQAKTIKELQVILKGWGLPVSGKKDDLITRLLEHQARHAS